MQDWRESGSKEEVARNFQLYYDRMVGKNRVYESAHALVYWQGKKNWIVLDKKNDEEYGFDTEKQAILKASKITMKRGGFTEFPFARLAYLK